MSSQSSSVEVLLHARTPLAFRRQNPDYEPDFSCKFLDAYAKQEGGETMEVRTALAPLAFVCWLVTFEWQESVEYYGLECVRTYAPLLKLARKMGLDVEALRIVPVPLDAKWTIKRNLMEDEWIEEDHRKWPQASCDMDSDQHPRHLVASRTKKEEEEEEAEEVVINDAFGGFGLSPMAESFYEQMTGTHFDEDTIARNDAALVEIVRGLKDKNAGTAITRLTIVKIPRSVRGWKVKAHAGREWVEEEHRNWGVSNEKVDTREYWSD